MRGWVPILLLLVLVAGIALGRALPGDALDSEGIRPSAASGDTAMAVVPVSALEPLPADLDLGLEESRDIQVFRGSSLSVVNITNVAIVRRDFFSLDVQAIPQGSGSGFVWDRRGRIVTNFHVIENAAALEVTLSDKSRWKAKVVGTAPDKDLAVLQIEAPRENLVPLELGRSSNLVVGQRVLALGNPFGLDHSLTVGVLSAKGREIQSPGGRLIRDVLQTDAAINPGNSGGPLLDSRGRLIGVNSAIYSPSGAFAGIGFAIPVDTVRRLVPQLIEYGRPIQPGIGVGIIPDQVASSYGIEGVVVQTVRAGGPAERAGLKGTTVRGGPLGRRIRWGDRIVAVNGETVKNSDELLYAFEQAGVGATVTLTVMREGRQQDISLDLVALE